MVIGFLKYFSEVRETVPVFTSM